MNRIRRWLLRRELRVLYDERDRLVREVRNIDAFRPDVGESHTLGTYQGLTIAIRIVEGRD